MGAQLVKEVSSKTNDDAGDGTTTATLLAQALVREGMKNVAAGANPMAVKNGIKAAVDATVEAVKANSEQVKGSDDIARVATVSLSLIHIYPVMQIRHEFILQNFRRKTRQSRLCFACFYAKG